MPAAPDRPRRSWGRSPNRPSPLPYSDTNFPSTSGALHEGALLADDAAGGLDAAEGLGGAGIRRQLLAVLLVSRQVREVDEAERDVARPRQLARHVVADALAAAALDVRWQRPDIGLEFGELVVIDRVADSECDHARSPSSGVQPHDGATALLRQSRTLRRRANYPVEQRRPLMLRDRVQPQRAEASQTD